MNTFRFLLACTASLMMTAGGLHAARSGSAENTESPSMQFIEAAGAIAERLASDQYDEAERLTLELLKKRQTVGIDFVFANLLLAQIYSTQERYTEAIPYLEAGLSLKLLDANSTRQYTLGLAHLYMEAEQVEKALQLLNTYVKETPRVEGEVLYMYSALLLQEGQAEAALQAAERALRTAITPPNEYYQLATACAQQAGHYETACAYLERMIELDPNTELPWSQLVATQFAGGKLLSALVALERAQEAGFMRESSNYITRIELLYNLERFADAATALEAGLEDGTLPQEKRLWEMLSYCYDLIYQPDKATEVLELASKQTSWSSIDMRLAERNWQANRFEETLINLQSAWDKGEVENPGDLWVLMASAALELDDIDLADEALKKANQYPEVASRVERLQRYVDRLKAHREELDVE